jgi:hypothetical protein
VYEDAAGRQYVLNDDGEPVEGVWVLPADEPVIVTRGLGTGPAAEFR